MGLTGAGRLSAVQNRAAFLTGRAHISGSRSMISSALMAAAMVPGGRPVE